MPVQAMVPKYTIEQLRTLRLKIDEVRQRLRSDGTTRCTCCGGFTMHFEGCPAAPDDEGER